jgi:regulator of protease activity HflC (stomatin/prohibitin superfamily)
MTGSSRKAGTVSLIALIVSFVFFVFTLLLGAFQAVMGIYLLSWLMLASTLVWAVLLIQFKHRAMAEQEKLDMAQLAKADQQGTIFSAGGDRMALFAVAQKRLATLEKWFVPIAGLLIALYEIGIGLFLYKYKVFGLVDWKPSNPLLGVVLMVVVAFVLFLFSRYASGMGSQTEWKPLRAGGSYLLASSAVGFLVAVGLGALAQFKYGLVLRAVEYIIPGLLIVLGIETILNSIFDIYRPRVAGQYSRASFDSRLLGLFSEPGGLLHTVAHTIDYQFGFQVSHTWFYKLLEKAILPLFLFLALTLYLMSCIVIVGPGQAAIIERFGSPKPERGGRTITPGMSLKWPWPIEIAYVYPTDRIQQIAIGYQDDGSEATSKKSLLWGEEHYKEEYNLLVATQTNTQADDGTVPVSIIRANIPIQYRIKNLQHFLYNHQSPEKTLEAICYRELVRFAASAKVEADEESASSERKGGKNLLGQGRLEAAHELERRIQGAADDAMLGIEVVYLGLQGIHPPPQVVPDYQEVIAAGQLRQATVMTAQADRNRTLIELAGSIEKVKALYEQSVAFEEARKKGDTVLVETLRAELLDAFEQSQGKVYSTLRQAESEAFEKAATAKGEGLRFAGQYKAFTAAPELYSKIVRLNMLEEAMEKIRKYIVVADAQDAQVFIVDLQEKLMPSIYEMDLGLDQK